jgi:hypothetical protein
MVPISHMIVPTSHMMVPTITLLGTLNFYLLFKFKIYKKTKSTNITLDSTKITYDGIYITFDDTNCVGTIPTKRVWVLYNDPIYIYKRKLQNCGRYC